MASPQHSTLGALLLGYMVATPIYGITLLQAFRYFRCFSNDSRTLKYAVAAVIFLETITHCFASHAVYYYLVIHAGEPMPLLHMVWSITFPAVLNGLLGSVVQVFFAWRVYVMSDKSILLLGGICMMSFTQLGFSLGSFVFLCLSRLANIFSRATSVQGLRYPNVLESPPSSQWIVSVCFATIAFTDILITIILCYFLQVRKSGLLGTDTVVNKIIVLTIHNGTFTSTIALSAFVVNVVSPSTAIPMALCFILGKAYSNTLLSSLNYRNCASERARLERRNPTGVELASTQYRTEHNKDSDTQDTVYGHKTSRGSLVPQDGYYSPDVINITRQVETFTDSEIDLGART